MKKRLLLLALVLALLLAGMPLAAEAVGEDQAYSYFYSEYGYPAIAPDPYRVRYRIDPADLGLGKLNAALGTFQSGDRLYICDTGNNRILQLALGETGATFLAEFREGEGWSLNAPEDLFVTETGEMYIADTGNQRVLHLDGAGNFLGEVTKPDHATYDPTTPFRPSKLVIAGGGRLYVQANGINRGLMVFGADGTFEGYMGASEVRFDWADYLWKQFSTQAQKAQMASFVPTEYNNVSLDPEGFLFVTTSTFKVSDLTLGNAQPVRRLNLKGKNILIENSEPVIGALQFPDAPSRFVDVTVLDNEIYYVLDSTQNRIFAYDKQGNGLYVFGGYGTREGYFQAPKALEHWGTDLVVLDSVSGLITVLQQTEYGGLINDAIECYDTGDYDTSYGCWQEILRQNGNYSLAYDGIGKIMLRRGDYDEALDYLKYAKDEYYYSKAWKLYRKDWIEDNLIYLVLAVAVLTLGGWLYRFIRREKEALDDYEALIGQ